MTNLLLLLACTTPPATTDTETSAPEDTGIPYVQADCTYVESGHGDAGTVELGVEVVASGLATPWGLAWLDDGDILLTERDGTLSRLSPESGEVQTIAIVDISERGEGGLLGIAAHPDIADNGFFYLYYTKDDGSTDVNVVERWTLADDGTSAEADTIVVDDIPAMLYHNGGRIRFGPDDRLYIGTGDATDPDLAQDPDSLGGKILRVEDDGSIPADNPYPDSPVWILGIRNTQGFDWIDGGRRMVVTDHGPSGLPAEGGRRDHDEISVARPGDNLGWPDIYACEEQGDFITPSITFADAMPPGGAAFYTSEELPEWQGDLLVGVMGFDAGTPHLHRLRLDDENNIEISETYLTGEYGRLREVVMGPDGGLFVTTSNCDGRGDCGEGDLILRIGAPE